MKVKIKRGRAKQILREERERLRRHPDEESVRKTVRALLERLDSATAALEDYLENVPDHGDIFEMEMITEELERLEILCTGKK